MRIHSLTMTGIGPYAGREHIDFDAVGASGRFLLTGPTGSGKTTIIDAIVFALYGDVADSADSSKERIRSTLVGPHTESIIELVFSTGAGAYRVRRTPTYERAKRRGQGTTTQNGTVKLWHLAEVGGEPLDEPVTRVGDADAEIARAVGLKPGAVHADGRPAAGQVRPVPARRLLRAPAPPQGRLRHRHLRRHPGRPHPGLPGRGPAGRAGRG